MNEAHSETTRPTTKGVREFFLVLLFRLIFNMCYRVAMSLLLWEKGDRGSGG